MVNKPQRRLSKGAIRAAADVAGLKAFFHNPGGGTRVKLFDKSSPANDYHDGGQSFIALSLNEAFTFISGHHMATRRPMRIVRVCLNDYDSPLIGTMVVASHEAEAVYQRIRASYDKEDDYVIDIVTPDDIQSIVKSIRYTTYGEGDGE